MNRIRLHLFVILAAAVALGGLTTPAHARKKEHGLKSVRHYERLARRDRQESTSGGKRSMAFSALGRRFDLELEPNALLAPNHVLTVVDDQGAHQVMPSVTLYKGKLRGRPDTWVRLSVRGGAIEGLVWTPTEAYVFQPSAGLVDGAEADETIAYRVSDTDTNLGPDSCAAESAEIVSMLRRPAGAVPSAAGAGGGEAVGGGGAIAEAAVTLAETELGLVADYEYYLDHGSDATAATNTMLSIINQIDGIYRAQLGVAFSIVDTVVYSTSSDPFSSTLNPSSLLGELAGYRDDPGYPVYGDDLVHLFTGRDLTGSTIGIAYVGAVCDSFYGAGLSENYSTNNNIRVVLTAHEMGHNFDAHHDDTVGSACVGSPAYIMQSSVGSSSQQIFSTIPSCSPYCCSREVIGSFLPFASCLSDLVVGTATPSPTFTPAPPTSTSTVTRTLTVTPTITQTRTVTLTPTITLSPTSTLTRTLTLTPSHTLSPTLTLTRTQTSTITATATLTPTPSPTPTPVNNPPTVADLLLWLDANQITGVGAGAALTTWFDASGFAHNATQASSTLRPTYQTNVVNGRPVVRFDGSNDYLTNATLNSLSGRTGVTAFVVFSTTNVTANHVGFSESARNINQQVYASNAYAYATTGNSGRVAFTSTAVTLWNSVFDGTQSGNAARLRMFLNGAQQGLTFTGTIPAVAGAGTSYEVGRPQGTNSAYWTGDIAEVVIYGRTLSETERQNIQSYLSQKYGLGIVPTFTPTPAQSNTPTHTLPPVATSTATATRTSTHTPVNSATATHTSTAAPPTATFTSTHTAPPGNTATATRTATSTSTSAPPTATRTSTHTFTAAPPTATRTVTHTFTQTATATPPSSFNPSSLAGLRLWLDADQITGLSNGSAVTTWSDVSGAGQHVTQASATLRPVYRTGIVNGRPVVTFDGANDYLTNAAFAALNAKNGATSFVVFKADETAGNHVAVCDSARNLNAQIYQNNVYGYATTGNNGRYFSTSTAFAIWNSVFDGTLSGNAARLKLFRNGAQQALTFTGTIPALLGTSAGYEVGRPFGSNVAYWDGDIAEIVVYDRVLSTTERQQVTTYLGGKYAIATN